MTHARVKHANAHLGNDILQEKKSAYYFREAFFSLVSPFWNEHKSLQATAIEYLSLF